MSEQHICSEIQYETSEGNAHSDLCAEGNLEKILACPEWRKVLHAALDEWLDKSNGTGYFYVGDFSDDEDDDND